MKSLNYSDAFEYYDGFTIGFTELFDEEGFNELYPVYHVVPICIVIGMMLSMPILTYLNHRHGTKYAIVVQISMLFSCHAHVPTFKLTAEPSILQRKRAREMETEAIDAIREQQVQRFSFLRPSFKVFTRLPPV